MTIKYQEIHNARRKLEKLQEQYLRENGWKEDEQYLWYKHPDKYLLTDSAVYIEMNSKRGE